MKPGNLPSSFSLPMQAAPCHLARATLCCPSARKFVLGRNLMSSFPPTLSPQGRIAQA